MLPKELPADPSNLGVWKLSWTESKQGLGIPGSSHTFISVYCGFGSARHLYSQKTKSKQGWAPWRRLCLLREVTRSRSVCWGSLKTPGSRKNQDFSWGILTSSLIPICSSLQEVPAQAFHLECRAGLDIPAWIGRMCKNSIGEEKMFGGKQPDGSRGRAAGVPGAQIPSQSVFPLERDFWESIPKAEPSGWCHSYCSPCIPMLHPAGI